MERGLLNGETGNHMTVSTLMTKSMEKEYFNGLMAVITWDFGSMVGKMESEYTN